VCVDAGGARVCVCVFAVYTDFHAEEVNISIQRENPRNAIQFNNACKSRHCDCCDIAVRLKDVFLDWTIIHAALVEELNGG
jgi:hypothetical protein